MSVEDVVKFLATNLNSGLTKAEIEQRLRQHGYNEIEERKPNPFVQFGKKFWGLTAWMLEITILLSLGLQKVSDAYIITALLLFNSVLGFLQEQRASSAVEALKKKLQVNARVLRNDVWQVVPSRELVPGDIIRLRIGDFVPSDAKVVSGELAVDQSALTGESGEVQVKTNDEVFSGSIVRRGEANAIVTLTGVNTFFGKTMRLVQIARPRLHMEDVISKVVKWLLLMVGVSLAVTATVSFFIGIDLLQILPIMLILLVSAIPVALPAMFTISMALGSLELSKNGVLVTRLNASEDAATMDIVCVDKTGTLTMNRLAIAKVIPFGNFERKDVLLYGALASQEANEDPLDRAFITAAKLEYVEGDSFVQKLFVPFDPSTRKTEAVIQKADLEFKVMKGAVRTVAEACHLDSHSLSDLHRSMEDFARKGYRTLAVARTVNEGQYLLVGLVALYDQPRPESAALIRELGSLGISVKMLTGDSLPVAKEIAEEVGIGSNIVKVSDLKESLSQNAIEATQLAENSGGFAEIYPEDKYTVVKSMQIAKHIVGMTGDGVNDAPALRQAEVGIAVSSASDVAKGAASVVLTSEGLSNIVDLVKIGRMIYQRIRTWIINKVVKSFLVIMFVVLAFLLTGLHVVTTFHIVLLLFVTDFVTISLSTDHVRWSEKPNTWNVTGLVKVGAVVGLLAVLESLGLLAFGSVFFNILADADRLHTFSFLILFYFSIFTIFVVREKGRFWDSRPSRILLAVTILDMVIVALIALLGIPNVQPIAPIEVITVIVFSFVLVVFLNDAVKASVMKKMRE